MGSSKAVQSIALVLCLNLLFFNMARATLPLPTCTALVDLSVCASLLGLPIINIGGSTCCTSLSSLADIEAAACLCAALKTGILNLNLGVTATLSAILGGCGKSYPSAGGYECR